MKLTSEHKRELERLIAAGKKIEAVKQFRNIADVGLAEAVAAINALEAGDAGAASRTSAPELSPKAKEQAEGAAMAEIKKGQVTNAILKYQRHSKLSLKESKDAVDILSVVHRTDGRVNAKLARSLVAMVAKGQKQEAITQLMSQAGYDEAEARKFMAALGGAAGRGRAGCLGVLLAITAVLLAGIAALTLIR